MGTMLQTNQTIWFWHQSLIYGLIRQLYEKILKYPEVNEHLLIHQFRRQPYDFRRDCRF